jgi:hypothetical protein
MEWHKFHTLKIVHIIGPIRFAGKIGGEITGNAFLREALSNPAQQVAQYLGFDYRTGIDKGVVATIPNIGPHPTF